MNSSFNRRDWIRTSDLYVPNVALYQAEPHAVIRHIVDNRRFYIECQIESSENSD